MIDPSEFEGLWESLYTWSMNGAPRESSPAPANDSEAKAIHLIAVASSFHRDKVSDILIEVERFKLALGSALSREDLVDFLDSLSKIAKRQE